jgi:hypothetical protein
MNMKLDLRNPRIRNVLIIAAIGIAGAVLWQQTVYVARKSSVDSLHRDLERKQSELNSILALKPQLKKLEKDIAAARVRLDSLKSMFPDQKEISPSRYVALIWSPRTGEVSVNARSKAP